MLRSLRRKFATSVFFCVHIFFLRNDFVYLGHKGESLDPMLNTYLPYLSMIDPLPSTRNEDKLEEIRKKYSETKNMPRKKKKRLRKELNQEYSFWYSIGEWEKSMYEF